MRIIKPDQIQKARIVLNRDIPRVLAEAREISALIEKGEFEGIHKSALALAASQMDSRLENDKDCMAPNTPMNYFVLAKKLTGLGSHIIINPKILSRELSSAGDSIEGCMSYPYKKEKRVMRYNTIRVEWYVPRKILFWHFLLKKTRTLKGLPALVFQHEIQHLTDGTTIYG